MNTIVVTYSRTSAMSVALTVWLAQTLHKNRPHLPRRVFHGNEALAESVNTTARRRLLLINFGT